MNHIRLRTLSIGPTRAFEAVSRSLNFRVAAEELHLTQSAVSRQIKALEEEVGAVLLDRDTRGVRITAAGLTLLQALGPWLARVDQAVRQIRQTEGRRVVGVSTFASFATLWLMPRLERFRRRHALDVRIQTLDQIQPAAVQGPGRVDAIVRYCRHGEEPENAIHLFDETLTPVASPRVVQRMRRESGVRPRPSDLAGQTLIEDLDLLPSAEYRSWSHWLRLQGLADLQPRHWLYVNLAHLQLQAACCGQGWAIGRTPLVAELLADGALVEPFGLQARLDAPYAYWLIPGATAAEDEDGQVLRDWIIEEAARTRSALEP